MINRSQKRRHQKKFLLPSFFGINDRVWTIKEIADAYHINACTVCDISCRFVEGGLSCALERKQQMNRNHKITGDVETQMIAIACSDAPEGRGRWTLQMIADRLVEL